MGVHDHGRNGGDGSESEEDLRDAVVHVGVILADAWGKPEGQEKDEAESWQDVQEGHDAVCGEDAVHCGEIRGARGSWRGEQNEGSPQNGSGCNDAEDNQGDPGQCAFFRYGWLNCLV